MNDVATSTQPDKWLSLQQTLPLSKLVYLDVGPFHQFLRLEFSVPESCFTFLLRDKNKCRECLTRLSSEIPTVFIAFKMWGSYVVSSGDIYYRGTLSCFTHFIGIG